MVLALATQIDASPDRRFGKPCIVGTRIAVHDIVLMHVRQGLALERISAKFDLSMAAVYAAMSYYYEYRERIDAEIDAENEEIDAAIDAAGASLVDRKREAMKRA